MPVYHYKSSGFFVPFESDVGWEAAVFDHYQALVTTIGAKLAGGTNRAHRHDQVGGSTYGFDLWDGHPLEAEVLNTLQRLRTEVGDLRSRVDEWNAMNDSGPRSYRATVYVGQNTVVSGDSEGE